MKYSCFTLETKTLINWDYCIGDHPVKGYYNEQYELYFHLIPKNASSFLAGHADGLGWKKIETLNNFKFRKGLTIIRDPISRWVSGIVEFFFENNLINQNFEQDWQAYKNLLKHNPIQDGHTSPQEEFLYNVDLDKFNFIFMPENKNIRDKIQQWLSNNGYANQLHKYEKENESIKIDKKMFALNIIKETLSNDNEFKDKIREHFKVSYDLIDYIGKTNKWI